MSCKKCEAKLDTNEIEAKVITLIHESIRRYYRSPLKCNHIMCGSETNSKIYHEGDRCFQPLCSGRLNYVYSAGTLYEQLSHLLKLFKVDTDRTQYTDTEQNCVHRIQTFIKKLKELSQFTYAAYANS
ncbi:DNA polymerase alpha zinc finger-domain-containing protein [Mycotypha africana]|uniref:DNA polymerase alpha zinc finger-domain-containing protein n=1 Tax=Mycotypha africana TaxID=64632 RepID=UPI002300556A|nr:DNA polymerase alpha zinc finger-domain-containing protein [Mycotypha africana]KAI8977260.1 DNA polymerase alpha zinc finger-domain-containing protein [Mycotypha africana]